MCASLIVRFTCLKIQELENDLRACKEEFKEFERQDVKYREDFKHMKQKIKKLEDKIEKVRLKLLTKHTSLCLLLISGVKIGLIKDQWLHKGVWKCHTINSKIGGWYSCVAEAFSGRGESFRRNKGKI